MKNVRKNVSRRYKYTNLPWHPLPYPEAILDQVTWGREGKRREVDLLFSFSRVSRNGVREWKFNHHLHPPQHPQHPLPTAIFCQESNFHCYCNCFSFFSPLPQNFFLFFLFFYFVILFLVRKEGEGEKEKKTKFNPFEFSLSPFPCFI